MQKGVTLVETLMVTGIMGVTTLIFLTTYSDQLKANNYADFQIKTTQIRAALIGQVLTNSNHCKCLFQGALPFPNAGVEKLPGVTPTKIGAFSFANPGDCTTATVVSPLAATTHGVSGVEATDISLRNIVSMGDDNYAGELYVGIKATRSLLGPNEVAVVIPVSVQTTAASATTRQFESCSFGGAGSSGLNFAPSLAGGYNWQSIALSSSGGGGSSVGSPSIGLGSIGMYPCGSLATATLTSPDVSASSKAALVSFYTADTKSESPAIRVFTTGNRFVGAFGRAGRDGDGKGYGAAGEMIVPLTNKQFRLQGCRAGGHSTTLYFTTKAVLN